MSADNWCVCPKCRAKDPYAEKLPQRFREDYEFYIDKHGVFHADYRGKCKDCGFTYNFNHSENLLNNRNKP